MTPDSRREWRSHGATRYWIVAPGWTDVEIKKPSPARRQIADWSFFLPEDLRSHIIIIIIKELTKGQPIGH